MNIEFLEKCKEIIPCDTARISKPSENGKMFLVIGYNRNTNQDEGVWVDQNGVRKDWDYVQESCIASGYTEEELIKSVKEYSRLREMTWEEYFAELIEKEQER